MIELSWKTLRFIIVGVLGALIYFICSYLFLSYSELPAYLASLCAFVCSFCFAYLGQKYWAFRSIAPHSVTLFRYGILQTCCATFAASFTQISVTYSDLSPLFLSALATVFTSGISYIVSSLWVFAEVDEQGTQPRRNDKTEFIESRHWQALLWILAWLLLSATYVNLYYYMPWGINLFAEYDDNLFVRQAYSLIAGDWLGTYTQFTLMKGSGYAFFLALVHFLGLPLYLLTAVFHTLATSFFVWSIYRLSQSRVLSIVLFITLLFLPVIISTDRIIRDQIYPDQFLMGFAALIFSLFVADTPLKRSAAAIMAGLMFAWLWLTREEGVWILPSLALLFMFALWQFWRQKKLKQGFLSSVLVLVLSFSSVHLAFRLMNWQVYDSFVGLDIKEKNFKATLAALQSVRMEKPISHVPVSNATMQHIYSISPSFAELKHFFNSHGRHWRYHGCPFYPWACEELAGGWFIWALREAAAFEGYYQTPANAADFFARVANEINQACDDGRLTCKRSLLSYMPVIADRDIEKIPTSLIELLKMLLLSEGSPEQLRLRSGISGMVADRLILLDFLHSRDRFTLNAETVTVFGRFSGHNKAVEKFKIEIVNSKGDVFPYRVKGNAHKQDAEGYSQFTLQTGCFGKCRFTVRTAHEVLLDTLIPEVSMRIEQHKPIVLGNMQVIFDKVVWGADLTGKVGAGERRTYKVRQLLTGGFQQCWPVLLLAGVLAFSVLTVIAIRQGHFSILLVLSASLWLAVLARLTILFLVEISSFPALTLLYFKPVYSLALIAALISIFLLVEKYRCYLQNDKGRAQNNLGNKQYG